MTAALNTAYDAYHNAKNDVDGIKNNIENFGRKWVGVRLDFAKATASSTIDTVVSVASAIFKTLWSLTIGILGFNKTLRDDAISSWKEVVGNVGDVAKSIIGIVCPFVADRFFHEHEKDSV